MKKIFTLMMAAGVMVACATTEQKPKELVGSIEDASMNVVTVKNLEDGAVYTFLTEDADKTEANGLLIGAPVVVEYTGELGQEAVATKVATDPTYAKAVGSWVMKDPINPEGVIGVKLMVQGEAESINMATLVFTAWELQGEEGKILLKGQSIGNKQVIDFTEAAVISEMEGKLYLTVRDTDVLEKQDLLM